jgi:type II secretory pathway pseudopilin PulG
MISSFSRQSRSGYTLVETLITFVLVVLMLALVVFSILSLVGHLFANI